MNIDKLMQRLECAIREATAKNAQATVRNEVYANIHKISITIDSQNYRLIICLAPHTKYDRRGVIITEEHDNTIRLSKNTKLETPVKKPIQVASFPLCDECIEHIAQYVTNTIDGFNWFYSDLINRGVKIAEDILVKYTMLNIESIGMGTYGTQYVPMAQFKVDPEYFSRSFFINTQEPKLCFIIKYNAPNSSDSLKITHIIEFADMYSDNDILQKSRLMTAIKLLDDL